MHIFKLGNNLKTPPYSFYIVPSLAICRWCKKRNEIDSGVTIHIVYRWLVLLAWMQKVQQNLKNKGKLNSCSLILTNYCVAGVTPVQNVQQQDSNSQGRWCIFSSSRSPLLLRSFWNRKSAEKRNALQSAESSCCWRFFLFFFRGHCESHFQSLALCNNILN